MQLVAPVQSNSQTNSMIQKNDGCKLVDECRQWGGCIDRH